jgi:hypothetical protein
MVPAVLNGLGSDCVPGFLGHLHDLKLVDCKDVCLLGLVQVNGSSAEVVLVSTPPFIIFALFFGLRVRRIRSDFLIRKSFPFLASGLFWDMLLLPVKYL